MARQYEHGSAAGVTGTTQLNALTDGATVPHRDQYEPSYQLSGSLAVPGHAITGVQVW